MDFMDSVSNPSPHRLARIAGGLYLVNILGAPSPSASCLPW
jgi:hypothetical protein